MRHNSKKKKSAKPSILLRRVLLAFIGLILGLNVYQWNANSIVGNAMPMPFGVGISVVLSGSMEPTLKVNDLVIIKEADVYAIGDIIVYQSVSDLIIHRIVDLADGHVWTQGDANNVMDAPIEMSMIKGKMVVRIPAVGAIARVLKTVPGTIMMLAAAIVLLELSWKKEKSKDMEDIEAIKREIRELRKEQIEREKGDSGL